MMSNATVDQNPKNPSGQTSTSMQNGLGQKNQGGHGDEYESSYMHPTNLNQPYGMPQTSDSYMQSFYGPMTYSYMGGTEWSSGSDSISYLPSYGGDAQQHGFVPDPGFNPPAGAVPNTPTYYNQPYNFFPANSEFSTTWGVPNTGHGAGMANNSSSGFSQQSAAFNGDYYQSVMPTTPHDYLGGSEVLPPVIHGNNASGLGGSADVSSGHPTDDLLSGSVSNGMRSVEQGMQSLGLGVSSIVTDPMKQPPHQSTSLQTVNVSAGAGPSRYIAKSPASLTAPAGQNVMENNANNTSANAPVAGSNAPKPVSWAAIASKPAKPQPKPKAKSALGQGLPPPIKHNTDIGTWDISTPSKGPMPNPAYAAQRWPAPRQAGNIQGYGSGDGQGNNHPDPGFGNVLSGDVDSQGKMPQLSSDENNVLDKLKSENEYNPKRLTLDIRNARFFVIKSYSEDDVHRSIKYNIWCSTEHGNKRLDAAFNEQQGRGPVILLYSVNGSGHFCGVAEMLTSIDYSKRAGVWSQDKWKGKFQVKWIYAKDVPNGVLRHIRLENNENKPVTNSRDTQEVPPEKGRQVLKIISSYKHQTSIFDDFSHYERREVEEGQREKRNNQMRSRDNNAWKGEKQHHQSHDQVNQ